MGLCQTLWLLGLDQPLHIRSLLHSNLGPNWLCCKRHDIYFRLHKTSRVWSLVNIYHYLLKRFQRPHRLGHIDWVHCPKCAIRKWGRPTIKQDLPEDSGICLGLVLLCPGLLLCRMVNRWYSVTLILKEVKFDFLSSPYSLARVIFSLTHALLKIRN